MPRFARLGTASIGTFGLCAGSRPVIAAIDYLIVGGGGTPGYFLTAGGGGEVLYGSAILSTTTSHPTTVGGVAAASTFNGLTARPGGPGGDVTPSVDSWGGDGGYGGSSGNGYSGGNGHHVTYYDYGTVWGEGYGGGGAAGAGGAGGDGWDEDSGAIPGYYTHGGDGGPGVTWPVDGLMYGCGRGGAIYDTTAGDRGGATVPNTGAYGYSNTSGGVILSYVYPQQLFTGGSVTSTGSGSSKRWFHSFGEGGGPLVPRYF